MNTTTKDRLLIVDDDEMLARSVKRSIELHQGEDFDGIFIASNAVQAEAILKTEKITVLLCDYNLDAYPPNGATLAVDWRHRFSSIRNAFIYSAGDLSVIPKLCGIDAIFSKTSFTWNARPLFPKH